MSTMKAEELHLFGLGAYGYVRALTCKEARGFFPSAPGLYEKVQYFALFEADGTPMFLTDSKDSAVGCAFNSGLQVTPLH